MESIEEMFTPHIIMDCTGSKSTTYNCYTGHNKIPVLSFVLIRKRERLEECLLFFKISLSSICYVYICSFMTYRHSRYFLLFCSILHRDTMCSTTPLSSCVRTSFSLGTCIDVFYGRSVSLDEYFSGTPFSYESYKLLITSQLHRRHFSLFFSSLPV